jgi:hypothetical protein
MPQYSQKDGRFCISYVTGPSHVWLGLSFSAVARPISVVRYPAVGQCTHGVLDESRLIDVVIEGVSDAGKETGSRLAIAELAYVSDDTPSYDLYRHCGYLIAKRVASGQRFAE